MFRCDIGANQLVMAKTEIDAAQQSQVMPQSEAMPSLGAMLSSEVMLSSYTMLKTMESKQTILFAKAVIAEMGTSVISHPTQRIAQWH
jgi:hypothetical protein